MGEDCRYWSLQRVSAQLRPTYLVERTKFSSDRRAWKEASEQPMLWAMKNKVEADVFVVYTDCETHSGSISPSAALKQYRAATGIDARLIVVAMTSGGFTLADPADAGMLDVVGFDAGAPEMMRQFVNGTV